jgi:hypothetical protein
MNVGREEAWRIDRGCKFLGERFVADCLCLSMQSKHLLVLFGRECYGENDDLLSRYG